MKKYNIICWIENEEQYVGNAPHDYTWYDVGNDSIEADSEFEAIDFALDYLAEGCYEENTECEVDRDEQEVKVLDKNGRVVQHYYNFKAEEV